MERFNYIEELALDSIANVRRIEYECNHELEEEQKKDIYHVLGECLCCKGEIYDFETGAEINDEEGIGICVNCIGKFRVID